MKTINIYYKKNDKVVTFYENQIFSFEYEGIKENSLMILEELEIDNKLNINIILSNDFFDTECNFNSKKISKRLSSQKDIFLYLEKEIFYEIKDSFKNKNIKIYSYLDILLENNRKDKISNNIILLDKEKGFEIVFFEKNIFDIKEIDINENKYNKELDFGNYEIIVDFSTKLDLINNIKSFERLENINYNIINKNYMFLLIYVLLIFLSYNLIGKINDSKKIDFQIEKITDEIDELNLKIIEKEDENKEKNILKKENQIFKGKKIPFYLDIEFFLMSNKFEIEYESIVFENGKWEIVARTKNSKNLFNFENELNKKYKDIIIDKIVNEYDEIKFIYSFRGNNEF